MNKPTIRDLRILLVQLKQSAERANSALEELASEGSQDELDEITRARARAEFDGVDLVAFAKALGLDSDGKGP